MRRDIRDYTLDERRVLDEQVEQTLLAQHRLKTLRWSAWACIVRLQVGLAVYKFGEVRALSRRIAASKSSFPTGPIFFMGRLVHAS